MGFPPNRGYPPQRRGFGGRIWIAIAIAIFGIFTYMSQVQENPVTGERQHVMISPDQEVRLGLEAAPRMAKEMGGDLPDSDPRTQVVQRIGNQIIKNTQAGKSPWNFKFHLLKDPETVNAFALPGGQIFITLGLYKDLKTEGQLAGVLSHEIGHVVERHSAQQMATSQLGQMLIAAVATGASNEYSSGQQSAMIASLVNQMFQLRYSREDETEADLWGIKLMEQVGYDPRAMIQVMQVLKKASGDKQGMEFFQTHPNPDKRMADINTYLKEHPPRLGLSEGKPLQQ